MSKTDAHWKRQAMLQLGLDEACQRAQLAYIDGLWKKVLGPAWAIEHLKQAVPVLRMKGPGILEAWALRTCKYRPNLWRALSEILSHE